MPIPLSTDPAVTHWSPPMPDRLLEKANRFVALHARPGAFVIPNPWDAGSARLLAGLGFEALTTTSAGLAFSLGRPDGAGAVSRDETLANAFSMSVGWQIRPGLRPGDRVTLALDGRLLAGVSPTGTSFTITPVDRGTHTLMVSIVDADGRGLCQSSAVTVHVRQPSLYSPTRRPVPTPRPRPTPPRG